MAILSIRVYPDPVLRERAAEVTDFGVETQMFFENMIETMREADGVGLAAPQVGVSKRILVASPAGKKGTALVIVNPVLREGIGTEIAQEGCLSFPGLYADIVRFKKIRLEFQDRAGKPRETELRDFFARVVQHELDHLNAVLMIDRIEFNKRQEWAESFKKAPSRPG
jgi:peptide deformylase